MKSLRQKWVKNPFGQKKQEVRSAFQRQQIALILY